MKPPAIVTALFLASLLPGQTVPPPSAKERNSSEHTLLALSTEKNQLESMLQTLLKLSGDELIQFAAELDPPDLQFRKHFAKYLEISADLAGLHQRGLGNNHPVTMAKKQELQAMGAQLDQGVIALRDSLQAKLEEVDSRYKKALAATGDDSIKNRLAAQDYIDAKRTYESEQHMLQAMKLKRARLQTSPNPDPGRAMSHIDRAIKDQEETVEQCRKVLANIVRARGIPFEGPAEVDRIQKTEVQPPPAAKPE